MAESRQRHRQGNRSRLLDTRSPTDDRACKRMRIELVTRSKACSSEHASSSAPSVRDSPIDSSEYLRLLQHSIAEVGFPHIARDLGKACGIEAEIPAVVSLREHVLRGDWLEAVAAVQGMSEVIGSDREKKAKFILLRQHTLQTIKQGDTAAALDCLRNALKPLDVYTAELHELAGCLTLSDSSDLKEYSKWVPPAEDNYSSVLTELQGVLPADVMLQDGRLTALLEQAVRAQVQECEDYCNQPPVEVSLFQDYHVGLEQLPTQCTQVLHTDNQIWHASFSPNGRWLATCSCGLVKLWTVNRKTRTLSYSFTVLSSPDKPVAVLVWSPNSEFFATASDCCIKAEVRVWRTDGRQRACLSSHEKCVTGVQWTPDNQHIVTCSHDQYMYLTRVGTSGPHNVERLWRPGKAYSMAASPDGKWLAVCFGHTISLYALDFMLSVNSNGSSLAEKSLKNALVASENAAAAVDLTFTADSTHILASMDDMSTRLYVLNYNTPQTQNPRPQSRIPGSSMTLQDFCDAPRPKLTLIHTYDSETEMQSDLSLRVLSCMGGLGQGFVATGTEVGNVQIWNRASGKWLCNLRGHDKLVNAVTWNPQDPHMLVSVSDDHSMRVWTSPIVHAQPS